MKFVVRAFGGGNVTIPKRNRELLGIEDGDYVRLGVLGLLSGRVLGGLKRRFKCARIAVTAYSEQSAIISDNSDFEKIPEIKTLTEKEFIARLLK